MRGGERGTGFPGTQVTETGLSPSRRPLQPLPGAEGHFQQTGQHVQMQPSFPKQRTHTVPRGAPPSLSPHIPVSTQWPEGRVKQKPTPHPYPYSNPPKASLPPRTSLEHPQGPRPPPVQLHLRGTPCSTPLAHEQGAPELACPPTPGRDLSVHFPACMPSPLCLWVSPPATWSLITPLTLKLGWVSWWPDTWVAPAMGREAPPRQGRAGLTLSPVSGTEPGTE